ncbi:MAG TPA: hypothetical protein VKP65_16300 [Rhodothermales bacterium]|nr:hypothetical protein [Rhodothermales bacterium]
MKIIGIVLIVLGILGLVFGSITWTETKEVVDVGPLEVETTQEKSFPIAPVASGAAIVAGLALVVLDSRKK